MATYALKRRLIDAEQFMPGKDRPNGVQPQDCYCADVAQDGRRCELHKENGRRYGLVSVGEFGQQHLVEIQHSDWILTTSSKYGDIYHVMTDRAFHEKYELVPEKSSKTART